MRPLALALVVVALPLVAATAHPQDKANPPRQAADESAQKVKDLQKKRIAALKEMVESNAQLFAAGRIEFSEVIDGQAALLQAELELAEKAPERAAIYKGALEVLEGHEKLAQDRLDRGRGNQATLFKARAKRLEIEIAWEKEKTKLAKENK